MPDVSRTDTGFVVSAELLGAAFRIDPAEVAAKLRAGEITSRCETGIDEDAGRWRLIFYSGGRALRLVVDAEGAILTRSTFPVRASRPRGQEPR